MLEEAQLRLEPWSMSARPVQPVVGALYQDMCQEQEQLGFRPGHSRDRAILPLRLRQLLRSLSQHVCLLGSWALNTPLATWYRLVEKALSAMPTQ